MRLEENVFEKRNWNLRISIASCALAVSWATHKNKNRQLSSGVQ